MRETATAHTARHKATGAEGCRFTRCQQMRPSCRKVQQGMPNRHTKNCNQMAEPAHVMLSQRPRCWQITLVACHAVEAIMHSARPSHCLIILSDCRRCPGSCVPSQTQRNSKACRTCCTHRLAQPLSTHTLPACHACSEHSHKRNIMTHMPHLPVVWLVQQAQVCSCMQHTQHNGSAGFHRNTGMNGMLFCDAVAGRRGQVCPTNPHPQM